MNKYDILKYTEEYLAQIIPKFEKDGIVFTCPKCKISPPSCEYSAKDIYKMNCLACNWSGTIVDYIGLPEYEVLKLIKKSLNLDIILDDELDYLLDFYEKNKFDFVQVAAFIPNSNDPNNGKKPLIKNWTKIEHKDKTLWKKWINDGFNIGLKTGKISNVTVIDFDNMNIYNQLKGIAGETLIQKTNKGVHYVYQYDSDLPKTRIVKEEIDIENDGGQVVFAPSTIDGKRREINFHTIEKIPEEFKKYLLSKISKYTNTTITKDIKDWEDMIDENKNFGCIGEGSRHTICMHLGGVLRKKMSVRDTSFTLNVINTRLCNPPLSTREFNNVLNSLEKYVSIDDEELTGKILSFLRNVGESSKSDIELAVKGYLTRGEDKQKIGKALNYLIKEEFILRKGKSYIVLTKADWKDTYIKDVQEVPYKVPYLHEIAVTRNGDLIVIGAPTGTGKTILSMNIIKKLHLQGVKPHYISLESGSRFGLIAQKLGIPEGSFYWDNHYSPEHIELENNAVTIIDWLLPRDYASTDKTYEHFARQLTRKGGILIVLAQLRSMGDREGMFYAEDMVKFFPSIVVKFQYEAVKNELDKGRYSFFKIEKVREPRTTNINRYKIPCEYNFETQELKLR